MLSWSFTAGGVDYSFSAVNLTFSMSSTTRQCVNITIVDDDLLEPSELFLVQLAAFDPNVFLEPSHEATITIADNDGMLYKLLSRYTVGFVSNQFLFTIYGVCIVFI